MKTDPPEGPGPALARRRVLAVRATHRRVMEQVRRTIDPREAGGLAAKDPRLVALRAEVETLSSAEADLAADPCLKQWIAGVMRLYLEEQDVQDGCQIA